MSAGYEITGVNEVVHLLEVVPVKLQRRVLAVAVRAGANHTRDHLAEKEQQPNKNNWPKTHFFAQAARSVSSSVADGDGGLMLGYIDVTGPRGIRQRLEGGTIFAKDKLLTIPARQEYYGKRAGEFNDLQLAFFGRDNLGRARLALVQASAVQISFGRKRKDGSRKSKQTGEQGGLVAFWLKESVDQDADPTVLPRMTELAAVSAEAGRREAARLTEQVNAGEKP